MAIRLVLSIYNMENGSILVVYEKVVAFWVVNWDNMVLSEPINVYKIFKLYHEIAILMHEETRDVSVSSWLFLNKSAQINSLLKNSVIFEKSVIDLLK